MSGKQASKRGLTLDLASSSPSASGSSAVASSSSLLAAPTTAKRARVAAAVSSAASLVPVLTTPDVQMLKLSSPEMAKFLTSANGLATPTPSGYIFPKTVTEEQELYAKGFEDALKKMQQTKEQQTAISTIEKATAAHSNRLQNSGIHSLSAAAATLAEQSSPVASRPSSSASGSVDSFDLLPEGVRVKEEADDSSVVSTEENMRLNSSLSPIDMESQERIKLERKRLRNRVAASKCRKRKLEKISLLDDKVQSLKGENSELAAVVKKLKASVCDLKQEVMEHMNNGCQIMLSDAAGF